MEVSGLAVPVPDPRLETAGFYKTSGIKIEKNIEDALPDAPPCLGVPPDLPTYRERGHRRLDARTYESKCLTCIRAGPKRKVPGRKGMSYTEEDWVDEDATSHRGPDD